MAEKEVKLPPKKTKILFILQEMMPYTPQSELASMSRNLPQAIQERGKDIRIMMPRYGLINERSHQLHEVYRLSNTLITINGDEKPLLIKVGAIPTSKIQTYFIDNEELFKRKHMTRDENNVFFNDNDERILFYCKGVLETVRQLNWSPDIIHCLGSMGSFVPLLIKTSYKEDPLFSNSKVIYTLLNDEFTETLNRNFQQQLQMDGIAETNSRELSTPTFENISKNAIVHSDAVIIGSQDIHAELLDFLNSRDIPVLNTPTGTFDAVNDFYEIILKR